jgi:hypothetical protein
MTAKIVKLVLICLILTASVHAAGEDVALITALTGTATASWVEPVADESQAKDEDRRSHEWKLEVAEMLPAGAEVTTGADSELTIIHLAGNVEYNIGASAQVRISEDKVEGQDVVSMPIKLVSADLGLAGSMQNQVGAVISDHVEGGPSSSLQEAFDTGGTKAVSFELSREKRDMSPGLSIEIKEEPAPAPSGADARMPVSSMPVTKISSSDEESEDRLDSQVKNDNEKKRNVMPQTLVMVEACFALPKEILTKVSPQDTGLEVEDYDIKVVDSFGGWVDFNFKTPVVEKNFNLNIKGSSGILPITLHVEDATPSVAYAWRLEKSGLLAQAASIWLKLQAGGMAETRVAPHLKRLREKLLLPQS